MNVELLQEFLSWCSVMNMVLLTTWFLMILTAREQIHRIHSRWFKVSRAHFDAIHYAGFAAYKIAIFLFNIVPYLALRIIS